MQIDILGSGGFSSALVRLGPGEEFVSESGAMYMASPNVDIDVTVRKRSGGGLLSGVKRLLAGESFFLSTYRADGGRPGEVGLAPTHLGEVRVVDLDPRTPWICTGGSYLGSTTGVQVDTQFQGVKGFFTGESISFLKLTGSGQFLVAAFGRIVELDVRGPITVDTGHVVAYQEGLSYAVGKAGRSWIQSWLAGEGIVLHFSGSGKILVQSHNLTEFGREIGPKLPPRS